MYSGQSSYTKVGRLKPDETNDTIRIITDSLGDIGYITRANAESLVSGVEPQPVPPDGSADLSLTARGFKIFVPTDGQLYLAIVKQVQNLLDKWPTKKAALFRPDMWGIDFWEGEFAITEIQDGWNIKDINREWNANELAGLQIIMLTGARKINSARNNYLPIVANTKNSCQIGDGLLSFPKDLGFSDGYTAWSYRTDSPYVQPLTPPAGTFSITKEGYFRLYQRCNVAGAASFVVRYRCRYNRRWFNSSWGIRVDFSSQVVAAGHGVWWGLEGHTILDPADSFYWRINPNWPDYDELTYVIGSVASDIPFNTVLYHYDTILALEIWGEARDTLDIESITFYDSAGVEMTTAFTIGGLAVGDKYRILDPNQAEYLLDDNSLPLVASAYWRVSSGIGDAIETTAIQWYWDGVGTIFLSYDPVKIGPIMFDDEIRIDVQNGTDLRIRDYALGSERIAHEGYTISRDTPDITSLCRTGINTITVTIRDSDGGGKVGYCTPVYVKRKF